MAGQLLGRQGPPRPALPPGQTPDLSGTRLSSALRAQRPSGLNHPLVYTPSDARAFAPRSPADSQGQPWDTLVCPEALLLPEWTGWTLWTRKSQPGFLLSVQTTGHTPAQEQGAPREKEAPGSAAGVGEDGDSPGPPFLDSLLLSPI